MSYIFLYLFIFVRDFLRVVCGLYVRFYKPNQHVVFLNQRSHFVVILELKAMKNVMLVYWVQKIMTHVVTKTANLEELKELAAGNAKFNINV